MKTAWNFGLNLQPNSGKIMLKVSDMESEKRK